MIIETGYMINLYLPIMVGFFNLCKERLSGNNKNLVAIFY